MNYYLAILVVYCLFETSLASRQRLRLSDRTKSSIKSYGVYRSPVNMRRYNGDDSDCDEHESRKETIHKSFTSLILVGDRDLRLTDDEDEHRQHCRDAKRHLKELKKHVKCMPNLKSKFFEITAASITKAVAKRCKRSWRKDFEKYSSCFNHRNVRERLHECSDQTYAAMQYVVDNVEDKYQFRKACCIQNYVECLNHTLHDECDATQARFLINVLMEHWEEPLVYVCKGKFRERCSDEMLDKFDEIYATKQKVRPEGFLVPYMKIAENHVDEE